MLAQLKSAVPFWISGMVFCGVSTMYLSWALGAIGAHHLLAQLGVVAHKLFIGPQGIRTWAWHFRAHPAPLCPPLASAAA